MRKHQPRRRPNQKARRKPHREVGVFSKRGVLRVVELRSTKGFIEQNGEHWRKEFEEARANQTDVGLKRGKGPTRFVTPVMSNRPKIMHRKTG